MSEEQVPLTGYRSVSDEEMAAVSKDMLAMLRKRRTVRDFSDKPVPRDVIETAIKAAATAPNGANQQPWHFAAISNSHMKRRICEAAEEEERAFYGGRASDEWLDALAPLGTDASKPFLETAPWLIAIFAQKKGPNGEKHYYVTESVGIAIGMLIATLHAAGLATLTHTPAPMNFLREICGRPTSEKPLVLLVVGHPAEDATVPAHALEKKTFDEIAKVWV
ncbi:nitroreductase family protein [Litorimonas sp. WD9-15]|uniref:nitroreductase family protein n=1 Tax=Litorimonas sp. WD9-15 TaxID=3418716 RepID=UPI003CFF7C83